MHLFCLKKVKGYLCQLNFQNMSYVKINLNIYILATLIFASTYTTKAQSIVNVDERKSIFTPSTPQITQSSETISLENNGATIYLPKVKKELIVQNWTNKYFATPNFEEEEIALREERKELKELSKKLGMQVQDPKHLDLYREAASWLGTRYRWAGNTKKGTDCSGLTGKIMKDVYDKDVDRSSHIIANNLKEELKIEYLLPGDLVFFTTLRKKRISHVGIYLGEGNFIHASRKGVIVSNLDETYYARTLNKAGRI